MEALRNELIIALHPFVARTLGAALNTCHSQGLNVFLFEGLRTDDRQLWLYSQGRSSPGKIVTNAKPGDSWHRYGLAGDLVFRLKNGQWVWDGDYEAVGKIMTAAGFYWGKHFPHFPELDHFEMTFGLTLAEVKALYLTGGNVEVWKKIDKSVGKPS